MQADEAGSAPGEARPAPEYVFLSDLHLGGDGELQHCDFATEFVAFLKELGERGGDVELIIGGDAFGFWELTTVDGPAKLDEVVAHHRPIFEQLRETGSRIRITLMVGNHDYDLACDPGFAERLAAWNLHLDTAITLRRPLLGRTIVIEHGQQSDPFNASPDYGNRYALPVGYFITRNIVAGASRFSAFGRGNWLKDIRSAGTAHIPDWLLSNYFYREMNWAIRGVLTTFLLLLTITFLALGAEALRRLGIVDVNVFFRSLLSPLGFVGNILYVVIAFNMVLLTFMLALAIPGFVIWQDIRRTLRRFQVTTGGVAELEGQSDAAYLRRAREAFADEPQAAVYLFGHTHDAFLLEENGRVIANMGTWLKILRRVPVRFGWLPSVYYPSFRLNWFHVFGEDGKIVIAYRTLAKSPERELGLLQRLLTFGRRPSGGRPIPERTVLAP